MCRVLIADDEEGVRGLLRRELERNGHDIVAEATSGSQAVEVAKKTRPDIAILDIRMPGLNGIDAAAQILNNCPCPVLFLTGFVKEELVPCADQTAAFSYIMKPLRPEELEPAISLAISKFQKWQEKDRMLVQARDDLESRKLVERAKGLLMERHGLKERDAFTRIHFAARNTNRTMAVVAMEVLEKGEVPN